MSFSPLMTASQSASASAGCSLKDGLRGHQGTARADNQIAVQGHHDAHSFSFMHVPVSYVHGRPVAVNLENSCNRPLFSRVQIGSVARARIGALPHHARNLAGRARGDETKSHSEKETGLQVRRANAERSESVERGCSIVVRFPFRDQSKMEKRCGEKVGQGNGKFGQLA